MRTQKTGIPKTGFKNPETATYYNYYQNFTGLERVEIKENKQYPVEWKRVCGGVQVLSAFPTVKVR